MEQNKKHYIYLYTPGR